MRQLRRIAIAAQLSASPAVRIALTWFTEHFAKHTGGALTREQFTAFQAHLIDYASAQYAGAESISKSFDLSKQKMQVGIHAGMLDSMVRHAAEQLNMSWPGGLDERITLVVDIEVTQVKGTYNAETVVVWSAA